MMYDLKTGKEQMFLNRIMIYYETIIYVLK